ncbi:alpha/beta hydrolase domain-containing protein [Streptomyces sp. NPDC048825]|uniref:alpha/beta hydrolase domain-containing protein n=1 Tax=Streptomyces sp. NPDC048825 TaxID=3365592 RepID=UPI00371DA5B0
MSLSTLRAVALDGARDAAFLSPARWPAEPHNRLGDHGYDVFEYAVSGVARLYTDGAARPPATTGTVSCTTRVLVVRPVTDEAFSGRVHVELLNPSTGYDFPMYWPDLAGHLIRSGDAYVGMTCKNVTAEALRRMAPERYGDLSFPHDGAVWDLLGSVATTLRSPHGGGVLPGLREPARILATGWSQSGSFLRTYLSEGLHEQHCGETGRTVVDAFLIGVSSGGFGPMGYVNVDRHGEMAFDADLRPVGGQLVQLPMDDARRTVRGSRVPVMELMSEDEALHHLWHQRPDSDVPGDLYRCYQLPGRGHESGLLDDSVRSSDHAQARAHGHGGTDPSGGADAPGGVEVPEGIEAAPPLRHGASKYLLPAAVENLLRWADGVAAPRIDPIAVMARPGSRLDADGLDYGGTYVLSDADGLALGGMRHLEVDLPVARSLRAPDGPMTIRTWHREPFEPAELTRRYTSPQRLRQLASERAWRLADQGCYLPEDVADAVEDFCRCAGRF